MQNDQHVTLRRLLVAKGLIDPAASWTPYKGGRTNRIWKIGTGKRAHVCKLYAKNSDTPLFRNSAADEVIALQALAGTGLAPEFAQSVETAFGTCVFYKHVPGTPAGSDAADVAKCLSRLHSRMPPAQLSSNGIGTAAILSIGDDILSTLPLDTRARLVAKRPKAIRTAPIQPVFLHGDPVPANIIAAEHGTVLIDWQCPAIGDPCDDLAIYLSPAMHFAYGNGPLSQGQTNDFLNAYSPDIGQRYWALAPFYHWRMAAYCAWKHARGDTIYAAGLEAEIAALDHLS